MLLLCPFAVSLLSALIDVDVPLEGLIERLQICNSLFLHVNVQPLGIRLVSQLLILHVDVLLDLVNELAGVLVHSLLFTV